MNSRRLLSLLLALCCCFAVVAGLLDAPVAWAGPVEWHEVPATAEGRQWWDSGSLRLSRHGQLTVLSRFQPSAQASEAEALPNRPATSQLYVMELDCSQELYRDISVNGLPRFRAEWQAASGDALSTETLRAACQAASDLLAASATKTREAADG
ncbi:MAG: hypothetical protein VKN56_01455 [Cyanobacteriota bacterium]|nr:hypothetical protein [Cyanobacteriota bacterium]